MLRIKIEMQELTERIIGAAIAVHRELGPGFLESVYEAAMRVELGHRGIAAASQVTVPVTYRGVDVGLHRLDLLVEDEVVVELKAVRALEPVHFATLHSYLRAAGKRVGLILNFQAPTLLVKRALCSGVREVPRPEEYD